MATPSAAARAMLSRFDFPPAMRLPPFGRTRRSQCPEGILWKAGVLSQRTQLNVAALQRTAGCCVAVRAGCTVGCSGSGSGSRLLKRKLDARLEELGVAFESETIEHTEAVHKLEADVV